MTTIKINNNIITGNIDNIDEVSFTYLYNKIYGAIQTEELYGIFTSSPIEATSNIIKWKELQWSGTQDNNSKIYIFLRCSSSKDLLVNTKWTGPYYNFIEDIEHFKDKYLQFMIVLKTDLKNHVLPRVDLINLSFFSTENAVRFFTKTFDIGFTPKHILLTYNAEESDSSIINFAVSSDDSTDLNTYQYISPNKIEELKDISLLSENIKIMIEMIGTSEIPVKIHEFATLFSGDEIEEQSKINKK